MKAIFAYFLWPNPGIVGYTALSIRAGLGIAILCVVLFLVIRIWRRKQQNVVTRKLSRSWASASLWFGITLLVLTVSRAEGISYVSMRLWFYVWGIFLVLYIAFQVRQFRARHYTVLPKEVVNDPREKYLPKKK